jgi:rhodanese-related sulfurtransferase
VRRPPEVPAVDAARARELLEEGACLLDVRELDEWDAGHVAEAVHVPLGTLELHREGLPTDRPIVAVCRSGSRSAYATEALLAWGHDAVNLAGGMRAWASSEFPIVDGRGDPGRVI